MKYRNPNKENDLFSMLEHQQEVMRTEKGINELNAVIDWELLRGDLENLLGYYYAEKITGVRVVRPRRGQ